MNVKVNDLVKVRVIKVMDDRFLVRLWGSDNDNDNEDLQYVMLGSDVTKDGDFCKYKPLVDNGVLRVKSIEDGIVYLAKSTAFPKENYIDSYIESCQIKKRVVSKSSMNVKVNDLVRVRVTEITADQVLVRLLYSDQQGVILPADTIGDFRKFVVDRNEVMRVKSIKDGIVYLSKNTVSPEEIYMLNGNCTGKSFRYWV